MRKHQVPVAVRPVKTLKSLLVHPKDKQEKEEITDCVYKIPSASCEKCYIGETWRKFGTRLKERKTEVESITSKPFTRNQRASSLSVSRTNQHWLVMHLMTTTWSIGRPPLFWRENPTKVLDGSKRQYTYSKRRTAILEPGRGELHAEPPVRPISCHVASLSWQRTGRAIEQTSSDEDLW